MPTQPYLNSSRKRLPSVTTILGRFKDSGMLIRWAYNQGREHGSLEGRGLPAPTGLYDKGSVTDRACAAGTLAHAMIEADVLGKPMQDPEGTITPEVFEAASNAFQQFRKWREMTNFEILATELPLVSEKHQFGGTIDAVGRLNGEIVLLDWKSSKAVYSDYLFQLAAYALLLEECKPEWTPQSYHIVRVDKDHADFAHHGYGDLQNEKDAFLLMRQLYDMVAKTGKR